MPSESSLRILIVDDEDIVHRTLSSYLKKLGHHVSSAYDGSTAISLIEDNDYELVLLDLRLPRLSGLDVLQHVQSLRPDLSIVIITGHGTMETAIQALRLGAADFLTKPVKLRELDAVLQKVEKLCELQADRKRLRETISFMQASRNRSTGSGLIGESDATERVREQIRLAIERRFDTILIQGETGTGKEVVAKEIHATSGAPESPFIAVACPAIADQLIESELFGHERGAFTGATTSRSGSFELADRGTLFLDEIADLSAAAQAKILRALETRKVRRVGGAKEIDVNVRVVAATNVPLEKLVEERRFRADLLYRLNMFSINLLPLRERVADIIPIAEHFLTSFASSRTLDVFGFADEAKERLLGHTYPGNARELRNIVERAVALRGIGLVEEHDLRIESAKRERTSRTKITRQNTERERIRLTLEKVQWNRREAAKILDMPYSTLRYKIRKYNLQ